MSTIMRITALLLCIGDVVSYCSDVNPPAYLHCYCAYKEPALIRVQWQDSGVGLVAQILRTCTPHLPLRHGTLWSTDVLHSIDRAHWGQQFTLPGQGYLGPASSALGCSLTPGQHTSTSWTPPPGLLCQEAQVSCARNRTTRTKMWTKRTCATWGQRAGQHSGATQLMKKNMMQMRMMMMKMKTHHPCNSHCRWEWGQYWEWDPKRMR